jgi:hypothetical protein
MDSGGKYRDKKKQKDMRTTRFVDKQQPFPGNGARKHVVNKSVSARILLLLSPQSIPRVIKSKGTCVYIYDSSIQ